MSSSASPLSQQQLQALDDPLIALTQRCGGDLQKVLGAFFSFLHRRTDFYMVPHDDDVADQTARMGFRQGDAEKLLLASFRQFPLRKLPRQKAAAASAKKAADGSGPKPTATKAEETPNTGTDPTVKEQAVKTDSEKNTSADDKDSTTTTTKPSNNNNNNNNETTTIRRTADGLQVPVGNGGTFSQQQHHHCCWTQTLDECTVLVGVGDQLRAKELDVQIKTKQIVLRTKNDPTQVFLQGPLAESIVPDESTWTLESGVVSLILYKKVKTFWSSILADADDDDKIDTSLVDSRRHISDYDAATQGQIRKIMAQQQQERTRAQPPQLPASATLTPEQIANAQPLTKETLPPGVEYIDGKKLADMPK